MSMFLGYGKLPNIVKDGLVLCLDAGNGLSYRPNVSGTIWKDLSGRNNNGTLVNDPAFSNTNGGSIVFDGTNDYVSCGNSPSLQITRGTISAWFNATNTNTGYNGILVKQYAWALTIRDNLLVTYDWPNLAERNTGITVGNNTWNCVTMTFTETIGTPSNNAIIYLNGSSVLTTTITHQNHTIELQLGNGGSAAGGGNTQLLSGNIAQALVYNIPLSASQVLQNYNATKSRFGL